MLRVLVVEDTTDSARMLCQLIRHFGADCLWAADGARALALADEYDPHLVVLDIGLPDMDGYAVATQLRERESLRRVRIVALSGYAPDQARIEQAGIDDYWMKPIDAAQMQRLLAG